MSKRKSRAREELRDAADGLVNEVNNGSWSHIKELKSHAIGEQYQLAKKLEKRAPGHSKEIYLEAVGRALWNNR